MNADSNHEAINALTATIISAADNVSNALGAGFLEKVYENALAIEFGKCGLSSSRQHRINVKYDGHVVGEYIADFLVAETVLIEVKAVTGLDNIHAAQCMNYLKATGLRICLLINFGRPRVEVKRIVHQL